MHEQLALSSPVGVLSFRMSSAGRKTPPLQSRPDPLRSPNGSATTPAAARCLLTISNLYCASGTRFVKTPADHSSPAVFGGMAGPSKHASALTLAIHMRASYLAVPSSRIKWHEQSPEHLPKNSNFWSRSSSVSLYPSSSWKSRTSKASLDSPSSPQ
eukprot:scaffold24798_cov101-Isochrysis_galbana.AAC.1